MFETKDSGKRMEFESGMVRDTQEGKTLWHLVADGPMLQRWAELLTRGAAKYSEGNWMKAAGLAEHNRFRASAFRHFMQWFRGDRDEDHAAAVVFNINGAEYTNDAINQGVQATADDYYARIHDDNFPPCPVPSTEPAPPTIAILADDPEQQELADHIAFIDNLILEYLKIPKILLTGEADYPENAAEDGLVKAFDDSIWERYDDSLPTPCEPFFGPHPKIIPYRPSLWQRFKAGVAKTLWAIAFEIDFVAATESALDARVCP